METQTSHSIYRALLLAPLVGPIIYYVAVISLNFQTFYSFDDYFSTFIQVFAGTPGSYLVTIIAGFPLYKYLLKNNQLSLVSCGIGGALIGGIILFIFSKTSLGSYCLVITLCTNKPLIVIVVGALVGGGVSSSYYLLLTPKNRH